MASLATSTQYAQVQTARGAKRTYNRSSVFTSITGMPLPAKKVAYTSKKQTKSHAHEREEAVLLKKVDRLRRKYVAFVSEATHGFLSVEMPPHSNALFPTALTDKLSLQSVFALLPSGHIASMGTNALLNLCDPREPVAPSAAAMSTATYTDGTGRYRDVYGISPPPPAMLGAPTVCTGYHAKKGERHYKLLRVTQSKTAEFGVMRL